MDIRNIISFLKKSGMTIGVGTVCGVIGYIEGAISGSTGAAILGHTVKDAAMLGAAGVGLLGAAEGLALGALAVNGVFGSYEEMKEKGFKTWKDRILGYVGYTGNQILGGLTAELLLKILNSSTTFGQTVSDVAVGAALTGIAITPVVTVCAALILAAAYHAIKEDVNETHRKIIVRLQ